MGGREVSAGFVYREAVGLTTSFSANTQSFNLIRGHSELQCSLIHNFCSQVGESLKKPVTQEVFLGVEGFEWWCRANLINAESELNSYPSQCITQASAITNLSNPITNTGMDIRLSS